MIPSKSKKQIRGEIEQQMQEFLADGGRVEAVQAGISARELGAPPPLSPQQPRTPRTLVNEVVAAIDALKHPVKHKEKKRAQGPQKKVILDDFGQPLRWEWVES